MADVDQAGTKNHLSELEKFASIEANKLQHADWTTRARVYNKGFDLGYPPAQVLLLLAKYPPSIRALRGTSKKLRSWVRPCEREAFHQIFFTYAPVIAPQLNVSKQAINALLRIGHLVRHVQLNVMPSTNIQLKPKQSVLKDVLQLGSIQSITIKLIPDSTSLCVTGFIEPSHASLTCSQLWGWFEHTLANTEMLTKPSHHRTMVQLREALESSVDQLPDLDSLYFTNLSIAGVQAFRHGLFSTYKSRRKPDDESWLMRRFWSKIKHLEVCFVKFWDLEEDEVAAAASATRPGSRHSKASRQSKSSHISKLSLSGKSDARRLSKSSSRFKKDHYESGLMQIHDWLQDFNEDLTSLSISWVTPVLARAPHQKQQNLSMRAQLEEYPATNLMYRVDWQLYRTDLNPLLMDLPGITGFTTPQIDWEALEKLCISGILIGGEEVAKLQKRTKRLQTLLVSLDCVTSGVQNMGVYVGKDQVPFAKVKLDLSLSPPRLARIHTTMPALPAPISLDEEARYEAARKRVEAMESGAARRDNGGKKIAKRVMALLPGYEKLLGKLSVKDEIAVARAKAASKKIMKKRQVEEAKTAEKDARMRARELGSETREMKVEYRKADED